MILKSRINRYIEYYNHHFISSEDAIHEVNCNIDMGYYQYDLKANTDLDTKILVNKFYKLDEEYIPNDLVYIDKYSRKGYIRKEVYDNFIIMCNDALKENIHIINASPFRSYERQKYLYDKSLDDNTSARPGYSEHQTGLAMDLCTDDVDMDNFYNTDEYKWMLNNGYKYGFILRYPLGMEKLTGYSFEPWHWRYTGKNIALYIKEHNITFDEYYACFIEK